MQPRYWLFLGVPYLYTVVTDNKHDTTTTLVDFAGGDMCFWHIDIYIAIETNAQKPWLTLTGHPTPVLQQES